MLELNTRPLQEQQVLLTAEPFSNLIIKILFKKLCVCVGMCVCECSARQYTRFQIGWS